MKARIAAAVGAVALIAGCGSSAPAGPPKAGALAAKLGCSVQGPDSDPSWAYDTTQYVDVTGSVCSTSVLESIITFPSQAKENDWLHQNSIAESSSFPDGYDEAVVGHLWVIASASAFGTNPSNYTSKIGGKDTSF